MPKKEDIYVANLAFLLNYDDGDTDDEIQYEIFKVAFQDEETVHYDRQTGGNFRDLEQEQGNISTILKFTTNLIKSVYFVNQEKGNEPYIVVGYNDIAINNSSKVSEGEYLVDVNYRILQDITKHGTVTI